MSRLDGQVALVTGASAGIGRATVLALAEAGAHVAIVARRVEALNAVAERTRAFGVQVLVHPGDITDPATVQAIIDGVASRFGRLDIVVNNAGGNLGPSRLTGGTRENWLAVFDLNLTGPFECVRLALPMMRARGRGTIVNVSSGSGRRPTLEAGAPYSAAKAGLLMLNNFINLEERKHGIRACAILVGKTDTPAHLKSPTPPSQEMRDTWLHPSDVADAVVYIATQPDRVEH